MSPAEQVIDLDLRAAAGDREAAAQARWLATHPDGPVDAADWAEASVLGMTA